MTAGAMVETKLEVREMRATILTGQVLDRLRELPDESVNCVVTSPPYWGLRDYGVDGQLGLENTPQEYIAKMVEVFREIRRVLRSDGTCWINLGDSYNSGNKGNSGEMQSTNVGSLSTRRGEKLGGQRNGGASHLRKPKELIGIPWTVAFALSADGSWLRHDIIWSKPNAMSGSQKDRPTSSHEYVFLLSKSRRYWSDFDAIKTPPRESSLIRIAQDVQAQAGSHRANGGAKTNGPMKAVLSGDKQRGHSRRHAGFNGRWDAMEKSQQQRSPAMMRDVWFVSPDCYTEAHFATMPKEIARRCILAGAPEGGTVLDPFSGSGTTGVVALRHQRNYLGIELNPDYVEMSRRRIQGDAPLLNVVEVHA